jgi:hypothetical protein
VSHYLPTLARTVTLSFLFDITSPTFHPWRHEAPRLLPTNAILVISWQARSTYRRLCLWYGTLSVLEWRSWFIYIYTGCSERRLIAPWLNARQFPAKALSHLLREMLPHGQNC